MKIRAFEFIDAGYGWHDQFIEHTESTDDTLSFELLSRFGGQAPVFLVIAPVCHGNGGIEADMSPQAIEARSEARRSRIGLRAGD